MVAQWCIVVERMWHGEVVMVARSVERGGHSEARAARLLGRIHAVKETSDAWCYEQGGAGRKDGAMVAWREKQSSGSYGTYRHRD